MTTPASSPRRMRGFVAALLLLAAAIRLGIAVGFQRIVEPVEFKVPDSQAYWDLGVSLARGEAYAWGAGAGRRVALRTPGYPLFIAVVIRLAGPSVLAVRIAQAGLSTLTCLAVYLLARRLVPARERLTSQVPPLALLLVAFAPYQWLFAALVLSECLFGLLLLGWLLLLTRLRGPAASLVAASAGMAAGLGTLVRPSWLLAAPLTALGLVLAGLFRKRAEPDCPSSRSPAPCSLTPRAALALLAGLLVVLAPWWIRTYRATGHFVATTLFTGASLYDGLNPDATGASDERFLSVPPLRDLPEWEQDRELSRRALAFARRHPGRVAWLMVVKFFRFWNPWPNDAQHAGWALRLASLLVVGPTLVLAGLGIWIWRDRPFSLALLLGPVAYFCAIHLIFVSSIRYREPALPPVLILAAVGLDRLISRFQGQTAQPRDRARPN